VSDKSTDETNYTNEGCSDGLTPIPFATQSVKEFADQPPPEWLIYGFLPRAGIGVFFGESGSGKTFLALEVAIRLALGLPWQGEEVDPSKVIYLCAEGAGGFRNRIHAYAQRHQLEFDELTNLRIIAGAPNLLNEKDTKKLFTSLQAHGPADVIFIDTFARVTSGANENAGEQMSRAIDVCTQIHSLTGAMVILIHHSGKDAAKGARGWSGIKAAMDVEVEVTKTNNAHKLRISKQKDGKDGIEWGFNLISIDIGTDQKGRKITSCYYEDTEVEKRPKERSKLKGIKKIVMDTLDETIKHESNSFVLDYVLIDLSAQKLTVTDPSARDLRKQHCKAALNSLIGDKLVQNLQGKIIKQ
jgi:hypothetical protein